MSAYATATAEQRLLLALMWCATNRDREVDVLQDKTRKRFVWKDAIEAQHRLLVSIALVCNSVCCRCHSLMTSGSKKGWVQTSRKQRNCQMQPRSAVHM